MDEIFNKEYIQEIGRELWQSYHDADKLDDLPDAVADTLAERLANYTEVDLDLAPGIGIVATEAVAEIFDIEELNREAEENTEDYYERKEASRGEY